MRLAHPLAMLALLPLAALVFLRWRRDLSGATGVAVPVVPAARTLRSRLFRLPAMLAVLAAAATVVALAGPERLRVRPLPSPQGVDIAVALDVSGSMAAEDFQPRNRLDVAKSVVSRFVRARPGDAIALVAFAGEAETVCPATDDHAALDALVRQVNGDDLPDGTAIGNALATAVARLRDLPGKSKIVVLITDGVNNAGQIDPETAARLAAAYGIRVYTIAVGRGGRVPITLSMRDPDTGAIVHRRIEAEVDVDTKLLADIATATGGRAFQATSSGMFQQIFDQIDRLEKSPLPARYEIVPESLARYPLAAGAGALACALLLALGPLRLETELA